MVSSANFQQYTFQNVFSGQIIYESWTLSLYNVIFTVLPPLAMGILDQFVSARLLDRYPQLYTLGQSNQFFRLHTFVSWIANAVYHSLLLYIFGELLWPYDGIQGDGDVAGHWVWGTAMYGAVLLTVLGKAGLITNNWTKYHIIAIPGSMALFLGFIAAYATIAPLVNVSTEYHGLVPRLFSSPIFWLQMLVLPILCLARDVAYKYGKRMYKPQTYHHIQEIQKYNIQDYRPRYVASVFPLMGITSFANSGSHNTVWNSSKKPFARSVKSSACANSEDTLSRKQTSRKHVYSKHTTRHKPVDVMERWSALGPHSRLQGSNNRAGSISSSSKRCKMTFERAIMCQFSSSFSP